MYHICAAGDPGDQTTGENLKKWGYDKYWLQTGMGGEVDYDLGTGDLHDGDYFFDEAYCAITNYTDEEEPLYPYSFAADGDILYVKTKRELLTLARDGVDAEEALARAGEVKNKKCLEIAA